MLPSTTLNQDDIEKQMTEALTRGYGPKVARWAKAIVGGATLSQAVSFLMLPVHGRKAEQDHFNRLAASWLQLQKDVIKEIGITIAEILSRLDLNDANIQKRIESPEYPRLSRNIETLKSGFAGFGPFLCSVEILGQKLD